MKTDFARAAATYDAVAVLAQETGRRMAERLDYVKLVPTRIADIGCATGDGIRELQGRYPDALPVAIDFALPMLHRVRQRAGLVARLRRRAPRLINADVQALPLRPSAFTLAWSNLMLHWLDDPLPAFRELHRILEVGGLLTFSALGPDTLIELSRAGAESSLRRFIDMHDLGDMLMAAGFADPVMDREMVTLTYGSPRAFLADQRHLGVSSALLGKRSWHDWRRILSMWPPDADGRFSASFEVVYGLAWKPAPRQTADGRAIVHLHRR